jgi:hypothetical protein
MVVWCSFIPFGAMGFGFVSQPIICMDHRFFVFEADYAASFQKLKPRTVTLRAGTTGLSAVRGGGGGRGQYRGGAISPVDGLMCLIG